MLSVYTKHMFTLSFIHLHILSTLYLIFSSALILINGWRLGKKGVFFSLLIFCFFSIYHLVINNWVLYDYNMVVSFSLKTWIKIQLFRVEWCFIYTKFNKTMLIIISTVTICVIIYSYFYMKNDPHILRFYGYICLFVVFMQILITANNYVTLFFGWEGVGVCSYLLINFWFTRINANKSAIKALLVNRLGDLSLIIGITLMYYVTGSVEYSVLFPIIPYFGNFTVFILNNEISFIFVVSLFLIIGAVGKSAQVGLHTWLPDAMEGPTPISALIHAATMVTAGVLLVIKSAIVFECAPTGLLVMTFIGGLTTFFAASIGLLQTDLKKVIAYSTCSQLGYMIFICGLSNYNASFFHLINHAFFKALLFLCAGSIIHSITDEQDLRKMGGLFSSLLFTSACFFIGSATLAGFPFLSGFYSKDFILETAFTKYTVSGTAAYCCGIITALFTIMYSYKIYKLIFIGKTLNNKAVTQCVTESVLYTNITLFVLTLSSIFFGWFHKEKFMGVGANYFGQDIYMNILQSRVIPSEFLYHTIKICSFFILLIGLIIIINFLRFNVILSVSKTTLYFFFSKKWFFDYIINNLIVIPIYVCSYKNNFFILDKGFFEMFGPKGLIYFSHNNVYLGNYKLAHVGSLFNYSTSLSFYLVILMLLFIINVL